jgi:hypothetical protein
MSSAPAVSPTVYLSLGLRVKDRWSPGVRLRIVLVVMSRFPLSVNLPQQTRQSYFNLCRVWKVREWRLWSHWFKFAISAPCSFPPPPYALLRKFFPPFLSACCNELEWMSSEANVLRRCAALDELRLESLRGPPSRRSSYWLGRDINPCAFHELVI